MGGRVGEGEGESQLTWQQLSSARGATKTLDVKDFRLGSHHKIIFAKGVTAFITFCTK